MDYLEQTEVLENELDPDLRGNVLVNISRTDRLAAQLVRLLRMATQTPKPAE